MGQQSGENDAHLRQILDNFPDGVFTTDTELQITYVNPAFCQLLDFGEQELLGTSITEYLGDLAILEACSREVAATGKCNHQETLFRRRDGSMVHISKNVQAIFDEAGNTREILVTIRDMSQLHDMNKRLAHSHHELAARAAELEAALTELRRTQEQLIENEKLASLGGMVAGVAHEINTPLGISVTAASTMHEHVETLREQMAQDTMTRSALTGFLDQATEACSILQTNLRRAATLIGTFKQVAADQVVEDRRTINLRAYCEDVLTSLQPSYRRRPIEIRNDCDPALDLHTHPGAVYQILSNLVTNSLTHAFDEQQPGTISITAHADAEQVVLDYRDDGKGIAAEHIKRIFEPFYTTRRGKGGSGLGLSIAYSLATQQLGGNLKVESAPGQGAHFQIRLPRRAHGAAVGS
jgi:PAS domain S-box-containing protein